MARNILVAYATKYGSTEEVAEAIGESLRSAGFNVDVLPVGEAGDPGRYDGVVLGSPLYMGKWLVEARDFVRDHQGALKEVPLAVFCVGYTLKDATEAHIRTSEAAIDAIRLYVNPLETGQFAGKVDPALLGFSDRAIMKMVKVVPGDYREWDAIKAWGKGLAALFKEK